MFNTKILISRFSQYIGRSDNIGPAFSDVFTCWVGLSNYPSDTPRMPSSCVNGPHLGRLCLTGGEVLEAYQFSPLPQTLMPFFKVQFKSSLSFPSCIGIFSSHMVLPERATLFFFKLNFICKEIKQFKMQLTIYYASKILKAFKPPVWVIINTHIY